MRFDVNEMKREMYRGLVEMGRKQFGAADWQSAMQKYQLRPRDFAYKVLGSRWWSAQEDVATAVVNHSRVAVRSGHGVGKTYLAADLVLWFLYTHPGSVVMTTAPTWKQVKHFLWHEIRKRFTNARVRLPGRLLRTRIELGDESYAMGVATEASGKGVNFQGCHADNLLIVLDEASGVPNEIWEAAEGAAVGRNNKILAIGNPLTTTGRFYEVFKGPTGWHKITINALRHPNVTGKGPTIPGCVTAGWIDDRIQEWCEEVAVPEGLNAGTPERPDVIRWRGKRYRPADPFRIRILGEFPRSESTALIPLDWIEKAQQLKLPQGDGPKYLACDVARYGDDTTVIGLRRGPVLLKLWSYSHEDTMQTADRIAELAYAEHPASIAVDVSGLGAGVVDRLNQMNIDGIDGINPGSGAFRPDVYANRRAELYFGLRDRLYHGDLDLTNDPLLAEELAAIRYFVNARGLLQIEKKEDMKRRLGRSPDRADMLAMLFDNSYAAVNLAPPSLREPTEREKLIAEMSRW